MLRKFKFVNKLDGQPEVSSLVGDRTPMWNQYLRDRLIEKIIYLRDSNPDRSKKDAYNLTIRILENTQRSLIEILTELLKEESNYESKIKEAIDDNNYQDVLSLRKKVLAINNVIKFVNEFKFNEGKI